MYEPTFTTQHRCFSSEAWEDFRALAPDPQRGRAATRDELPSQKTTAVQDVSDPGSRDELQAWVSETQRAGSGGTGGLRAGACLALHVWESKATRGSRR